jgi:hypothetical protein
LQRLKPIGSVSGEVGELMTKIRQLMMTAREIIELVFKFVGPSFHRQGLSHGDDLQTRLRCGSRRSREMAREAEPIIQLDPLRRQIDRADPATIESLVV